MNSCEESDFSDFMVIEKSSFRVRLCLQRYYTDVRSLSFMFVSKWKRVRWLEDRIRKLFSIHGCFYLCSQGHLLPSSEPLAILNPDDQIEVIPQELSNDAVDGALPIDTSIKKSSHKLSKDTSDTYNKKISTINSYDSVETIKRKKCEALDAQKDKNINESNKCQETVNSLEERNNYQNGLEVEECTNTASCGNEELLEVKQRALALLDKQFSDTVDVSEERPSSRRTRKRVRKRKRPQSDQVTQNPTSASETVSVTIHASDTSADLVPTPPVTFTPTSPVVSNNNHIDVYEVPSPTYGDSELPTATSLGDIGPVISRNEAVAPRKPRVIYALENI